MKAEPERFDRTFWLLCLAVMLKLALHVVVNTGYGFHRDELATLSDARHLDFGYVAYPPVTPVIGRAALALFGTSLTGFRFFAALAQAAAILLTALMARRFGGGPFAMFAAAGAVAISPVSLVASSLFQYVAFDHLWFIMLSYCVLRLLCSDDQRWWIPIGIIIGVAIETKYTIAFFVVGLVVGVLATPLRSSLAQKWIWIGAAIAIAMALPNVIWQWQHNFITLDFLRHIHERDVQIGRTSGFLVDQFFESTNPLTVPLWMLGLYVVLISARGRAHRIFGWMTAVPFVLFLLARGRGYYLAPAYPVLFAAGAADLERMLDRVATFWQRTAKATVAAAILLGSCVAFAVLPIGRPGSALFRFALSQNGDLPEELGWPELVQEVARIYAALPADERARTGIFCANYGEAGAVDLYGPAYRLPAAISGVNSYWERGPGSPAPETVIVLGSRRERLEARFSSVELAGHTPNPWRIENEETKDHPDIFVCRGLREPWWKLWPQLRSFG